jgi:hypothetical protein
MKNTLRIFILFAFMLSLQAFSIDEILVTGTRDGSGTGGSVSLTGSVYNRTESAAKDAANEAARKAEAESRKKAAAACLLAEKAASIDCKLKALAQKDMDQLGCAALSSTAAITTTTGAGAVTTGVGAGPGLVLVGLGAIEGAGSVYCYNHAQNVKDAADLSCEKTLLLKTAMCESISPK